MSRRPTGRAVPAAERMHHWRKRQRARGLKPVVTWIARQGAVRAPGLLDLVYRNFERWESHGRQVPGCAIRSWRKVLKLQWPRIADLLTEQSPNGLELRSTAPLFGVLTAQESRRIARAFQPEPSLTPAAAG